MIEVLKNCLPVFVTTCEALHTVAIRHCRLGTSHVYIKNIFSYIDD